MERMKGSGEKEMRKGEDRTKKHRNGEQGKKEWRGEKVARN
jgi:hypothetical protein